MSEASTTVAVEFDSSGLVPVVAQEGETGQVLMLAYADREAISRTTETGLAHYYSRSREELWQKGATSGNVQRVDEIRIDCDGDSVLYVVSQEGGACHTGYGTCFYRSVEGVSTATTTERSDDTTTDGAEADEPERERDANDSGRLAVETEIVAERVFDPDAVYDD